MFILQNCSHRLPNCPQETFGSLSSILHLSWTFVPLFLVIFFSVFSTLAFSNKEIKKSLCAVYGEEQPSRLVFTCFPICVECFIFAIV